MSKYLIEIKYTSNDEKTGKISIKGNDFSMQSDIVLPKELHKSDRFYITDLQLNTYIPEQPSINNSYNDRYAIDHFQKIFGEHYFSKDTKNGIQYPIVYNESNYSDGQMGVDKTFSIGDRAVFSKLKQICEEEGVLNIEAKSKWFMLGQKKAKREPIHNFEQYKKLGSDIVKEEKELRSNKSNKKETKNSEIYENIYNSVIGVGYSDTSIKKKTKEVPKNTTTSNLYGANVNKRQNYSKSNNDDLDAFDVMFMTSFPELAPMYRPTSGLAWMMYFSNQENHERFMSNPSEYIREVKGFENVGACEIKSGGGNFGGAGASSSFKVDLYEDEAKTKPLGTLSYNEEKGLKMEDPVGNISYVAPMAEKEGYSVLTEGVNKSKSVLEIVSNSDNEFVGNWTIEPKNSIPVSSSVSIDNDFSLSSNTEKLIDLDTLAPKGNNMKPEPAFEPTPKIEEAFTYKQEYVPPPPPPPPPPEDQFSYNTSDPYSRTAPGM